MSFVQVILLKQEREQLPHANKSWRETWTKASVICGSTAWRTDNITSFCYTNVYIGGLKFPRICTEKVGVLSTITSEFFNEKHSAGSIALRMSAFSKESDRLTLHEDELHNIMNVIMVTPQQCIWFHQPVHYVRVHEFKMVSQSWFLTWAQFHFMGWLSCRFLNAHSTWKPGPIWWHILVGLTTEQLESVRCHTEQKLIKLCTIKKI